MRVDLTPTEISICKRLGELRHKTSRQANITCKMRGNQSAEQVDFHGMIGEMVAAKALNLFPDLTPEPTSGGHDLIGRNGKTIDIKATPYKTGRLLVTTKKKKESCDYYMLVIVDDTGGEIIGYASKEKVFQDKYLGDVGHGETYVLEQNDLTKI